MPRQKAINELMVTVIASVIESSSIRSVAADPHARGEEEEKEEIARLSGGACGVGGSGQRILVTLLIGRVSHFFNGAPR
jgi:hypothetical protein